MNNLLYSIQAGTQVSFRYKMMDNNGNVLFNNLQGKSVTYIHGNGDVSPVLENNIEGLVPGASKAFVIKDEFDENKMYFFDIIIDSLVESTQIINEHCGTDCNCRS